MSGHFGAFSFVDRITHLEVGKRATGRFAVPAQLAGFSRCLALEAAGQLAAWAAMAALDFRLRPVAGVAINLRFGAEVPPGGALDLTIDIDSCDAEAVSYSASACVDGVNVIELEHSVGPMLATEGFDAPEALRAHFELLCASGAPAGRFQGVPNHDLEPVDPLPGKGMRTMLRVPREAPFFSDHFPRRPVFPGTMLLDAHIEASLAAAARSGHWPPDVHLGVVGVPSIKLRAFISPGDCVELLADFSPPDDDGTMLAKTTVRMDGRQIAMGQLEIAAMGASS